MKRFLILIGALACIPQLVFAQKYNPVANPDAVVQSGETRFTILKPGVIRMEWSPTKSFEDHASMVFVNRNLPVPHYTTSEENGWLIIKTDRFTLRYQKDSGKFTADNLRIEFSMDGKTKQWDLDTPNTGNMKGTARTLDGYNGRYRGKAHEKIDLGTGLISRDGWVLIDDSDEPLFDNSDWPWVMERPDTTGQDLYFFCYGYDYKSALKDYTDIAGKIPMPPRFVFGAWWSRYWEYTDLELRNLVREFHSHDVPLDVLVVDMDWHITSSPEWYENGKKGKDQAGQWAGWTGFTWNKHYFPDPENFLNWTQSQNLKVCLNLHPASGIQPHEKVYPEMAKAMGIDPATKKYVPFDIVDKKFAKNFMDIVLHPMQKDGVDFWWLDWQQWSTTAIKGMNPTFYLNYVFYSDMQHQGNSRPLIFHRCGGLGNHRYEIGFSGDTYITWKSLAFQPYYTATASNVGFGYWSHDIGGHYGGCSDGEMYTRWVQWGAFSPVLRTHCTKNACIERRIWAYPLKYFYPMRDAYQMRYAMIPYIYSQSRKAYDTGVSILRPMYYSHPRDEQAYLFPDEYMFGDDMLVRPVTAPLGEDSLYTKVKLWLPQGDWYEWYTGSMISGGRMVERSYTLNEIPVFARAGAVIPMQPKMENTHEKSVDPLILNVVPGDSGSVSVYEDAGNNDNYKNGKYAFTDVDWKKNGLTSVVHIHPVRGEYGGMLRMRAYEIKMLLTFPPEEVQINGQPVPYDSTLANNTWKYDGDGFQTVVLTPEIATDREITVTLRFGKDDPGLLSGKKGQTNRLIRFMKILAEKGWDKSKYSNDTVVYAAQLMHRLTMHPDQTEEAVKAFNDHYNSILEMIRASAGEHPEYLPYLDMLSISKDL